MWCGGVVVVVVFLSIIIPHQPSCFVLLCVVGWIVAISLLILLTDDKSEMWLFHIPRPVVTSCHAWVGYLERSFTFYCLFVYSFVILSFSPVNITILPYLTNRNVRHFEYHESKIFILRKAKENDWRSFFCGWEKK